jgi:hypothetical protein
MALFDAYSGVRKHGFQLYKKNTCLLVKKELCDKRWEELKDFFSDQKSDYNLVYYLGDYGITASYTNLYCSKSHYDRYIKDILKKG